MQYSMRLIPKTRGYKCGGIRGRESFTDAPGWKAKSVLENYFGRNRLLYFRNLSTNAFITSPHSLRLREALGFSVVFPVLLHHRSHLCSGTLQPVCFSG